MTTPVPPLGTPGQLPPAPQRQAQPQPTRWPSTARSAGLVGLVAAGGLGFALMVVPGILRVEAGLDLPDALPMLLMLGTLLGLGPSLGVVLTRRVRAPLPRAVRSYRFQLAVVLLSCVGAVAVGLAVGVVAVLLVALASLVEPGFGWALLVVPVVGGLAGLVALPLVYLAVHPRAERRAARREQQPAV